MANNTVDSTKRTGIEESPSARAFIGQVLKFSLASWINFIIGIAAVVIITRLFDPSMYGLVNIFNNASSFLLAFVSLGLDMSYMRHYYEPPRGLSERQVMMKCLFLSLLLLAASALIICTGFSSQLSTALFGVNSGVVLALLFISVLSSLVLRYLNLTYRLQQNAKMYTVQSVLVQACTKLFLIFAVFYNPNNFEIVITFNVLGIFFVMLIYLALQYKSTFPKHFDKSRRGYHELMKFGIPTWISSLVQTGNTFLASLIISNALGYYAVGIFSSASVFLAIVSAVQGGFTAYWSAYIYKNYKTDQERIIQMNSYIALFCVLMMAAFILFRDVLFLFLGASYQSSKSFFALVLLPGLLTLLSETTSYGINISKKTYFATVATVASMLINISLCVLLLPIMNVSGAAVAATVSAVVWFSLRSVWGQRYYKSIRNAGASFFSVFMMCALAIINLVFTSQVIVLVLSSILTLVISVLVFWKQIALFASALKKSS